MLTQFPLRTMPFIYQLGNKMVKLSKFTRWCRILKPYPHKSSDPQNYSNGHKRSIFTSVYYEIPNFCVTTMVPQLWNQLQKISDGQIMLCRKIFCHFSKQCTKNTWKHVFWGSGITPKTLSGGHVSIGTTQQSQRLTLIRTNETNCSYLALHNSSTPDKH